MMSELERDWQERARVYLAEKLRQESCYDEDACERITDRKVEAVHSGDTAALPWRELYEAKRQAFVTQMEQVLENHLREGKRA